MSNSKACAFARKLPPEVERLRRRLTRRKQFFRKITLVAVCILDWQSERLEIGDQLEDIVKA